MQTFTSKVKRFCWRTSFHHCPELGALKLQSVLMSGWTNSFLSVSTSLDKVATDSWLEVVARTASQLT